ncbi:hypothetical protein CAPTEDRAFT_18114, partial [Capitella teleta]
MKNRWRKVLYENHDKPDNYIDETFLDDLKKNLYVRKYDLWTVIRESGVVTQQISCVCIFVLLFIYMKEDKISPQMLVAISLATTFVGYLFFCWLSASELRRSAWADLKSAGAFLTLSFGLSPILMTLTSTISTDTVYAMTVAMLLTNLLFHDYGANAAIVSQSLSLNAAIFSAVCLASRLPTRWHAFATLALALQIFALWPSLRICLKQKHWLNQCLTTLLLTVLSVVGMATISFTGAVLLALLHLFISFGCSTWLIALQPLKNNIHGPWDEAVISN